jgi:AcrR family transcriptional regulator
MNMVQSNPEAPKVLDQARRRRTIKAPDLRRREILDAAADLFSKAGFEATGVQAIAEKAGVAAGTVYLYFPSKEAILTALKEEFEAGLVDRFAEVSEAVLAEEDEAGTIISYQETIDRLIDGIVAFTLENRTLAAVLARHASYASASPGSALLRGQLTELLGRVIREGVRLGYIESTDPEVSAYLLHVASATAIGQAIASEDEGMLQRVVAAAKELYIKALAPSEIPE